MTGDGSSGSPSLSALATTYRARAGLTQEQLSDLTDVSVRAIGDIERGRARWPQHRTVDRVAAALGLSPAERDGFVEAARKGKVAAPRLGSVAPLPAVGPHFTGRDAELAALADRSDGVVVLHGMPGIGKTSVAVRAGHQLADRFPGGQAYLARAEVADPPRGRRTLLVVDDAVDEAAVAPFLDPRPGCLVVVTSRGPLAGVASATRIDLGGLARADGVRLLGSVLGPPRLQGHGAAVERLVDLCDGLPLALRVVANRLATRPHWPVAHLANQLRDHRALVALTAGDLSVRAAFDSAYRRLPDNVARVFRDLGDATEVDGPRRALDHLVAEGLLTVAAGRYAAHPLVRAFAGTLTA